MAFPARLMVSKGTFPSAATHSQSLTTPRVLNIYRQGRKQVSWCKVSSMDEMGSFVYCCSTETGSCDAWLCYRVACMCLHELSP